MLKSVIKSLIVFAVVFVIIFVCIIFVDKDKSKTTKNNSLNSKNEYVINDNLYFTDSVNELVLYKDNTYIMYTKDNINAGSYKIEANVITLTQTKQYNSSCYELKDSIYKETVTFNDKNELTNVTLNGKVLKLTNITELVNVKKILLENNVDCLSKTNDKTIIDNTPKNNTTNNTTNNTKNNTNNNTNKTNNTNNNTKTKCSLDVEQTIKLDPNGGRVSTGKQGEITTPTKDGYNFLGWYVDSGLTKKAQIENGKVKNAVWKEDKNRCNKFETILYAKWELISEPKQEEVKKEETKNEYMCSVGQLKYDDKLGYICITKSKYSSTTYDYKCAAIIYSWDCPNKGFSSIQDETVGCYSDALVSSYNACKAASCKVKDKQIGSYDYYTTSGMNSMKQTYKMTCEKESYTKSERYCTSGWTMHPESSYCYQNATLK